MKFLKGYFYKMMHRGDKNQKMRHPFLYIGNFKNKGIFIQFSSVKYDENGEIDYAHFDNEEISEIIDLDSNDGLEFHSRADLNTLQIIDLKKNNIVDLNIDMMEKCLDESYEIMLEKLSKTNYDEKWVNELIINEYNIYFNLEY